MAALKGGKTLAELAQQFDVHPNQITDWKDPLMERAAQVLGDGSGPASIEPDLTKLHAHAERKKKRTRTTLARFIDAGSSSRYQQEHLINAPCWSRFLLAHATTCDTEPKQPNTQQRKSTWLRNKLCIDRQVEIDGRE